MLKVAINGTGRIGLCATRILSNRDGVQIVAINTTMSTDMIVHLLRYDSLHGHDICVEKISENEIAIGNSEPIVITHERDLSKLDFAEARVVFECSGAFNSLELASAHLKGNVNKVIISAPADGAPTFVYGVNHKSYQGQSVVSNASCTTNALAPLISVINEHFPIISGLMTTVHSYTNDQNLLDSKHSDFRRARAAALNLIPSKTGASKAIDLIFPELAGKIKGTAIRVPTPDVSLIDLNLTIKSDVSLDAEMINRLFFEAMDSKMRGILSVDRNYRVSSDFIGDSHSCVLIPDHTLVIQGQNASIKLLAWYDNEIGYTNRMVDLGLYISKE